MSARPLLPTGTLTWTALNGLGGVLYWQGNFDAARRVYVESLAIARELNDRHRIAEAIYNIAYDYRDGNFDEVERATVEALEIYRSLGDRASVAKTSDFLGLAAIRRQDYETAYRCLTEAHAVLVELGRPFQAADDMTLLGLVLSRQGDLEGARRLNLEALETLSLAGNLPSVTATLDLMAIEELEHGHAERALRLIGGADGIRERSGGGLSPIGVLRLNDPRVGAAQLIGEAAAAAILTAARTMSTAATLAYAREPDAAEAAVS